MVPMIYYEYSSFNNKSVDYAYRFVSTKFFLAESLGNADAKCTYFIHFQFYVWIRKRVLY